MRTDWRRRPGSNTTRATKSLGSPIPRGWTPSTATTAWAIRLN
ncbi:hypothetical protein [Lysobacter gummosus]